MRIGIVGIGGVGGYFGGKLARTYAYSGKHDIIFIARGEHLKAVQEKGLQLFTQEGDYTVLPNIATDHPVVAGPFDLVFFCVKSYALEYSARLFKDCIQKNTVVIPLQNGVNSTEVLRSILPHADVIAGSVLIISHIENPGRIRQEGGACRLTFGTDDPQSSQKYTYILDILTYAGIQAVLTDKISEALWTKYLLMCPMASLMSVTDKTYGEIWANEELRSRAKILMQEVVAVARGRNIFLPESLADKTLEMVGRLRPDSKTSMQLDIEKGKPTEIDILTAFLCQAGRESGVPTPMHDELYRRLVRRLI